jgi:hypothetical protein
MLTKWTQHLKETKDQEDFKESIYRARSVLDRLRAMCDEFESAVERSEQSPKVYDCANWSHLQAHYNGFKQCLSQFKSLLDQRDTDDRRPVFTK